MKYTTRLLLAVLLTTTIGCTSNSSKQKPRTNILAYYVPEKEYKPETIPVEKLTHIIFSFTEVVDNEMKFKNEKFPDQLKQLVAQKSRNNDLKVMIACGGWGGCAGFSDMASDPVLRKKFVDSAMEFIKHYELDGVDMDWEYPGMRGAGNMFRKEDTQNFTSLMRELREGLDNIRPGMVLTFASAGWERYYDHIEVKEVMKYADFMNIMTYDLIGSTAPFTAHHTNLGEISEADVKGTPMQEIYREMMKKRAIKTGTNAPNAVRIPNSAEKIVKYIYSLGVKPEQMVIGGAFYGRAWEGVGPENNGLYQANKGSHIGWSEYKEIREKYEEKNGYVRHWDPVAKAPFLYSAKDSIFFSYDDTVSVRLKTEYALKEKLGGMMFWELGNDTKEEDSLLDAIYKAAAMK